MSAHDLIAYLRAQRDAAVAIAEGHDHVVVPQIPVPRFEDWERGLTVTDLDIEMSGRILRLAERRRQEG
jgi:hypothetical protein